MGYNLTQINPAYELVSEVIVGTATTSVTFSSLNFGKTDDLLLVGMIINPIVSGGNYRVCINNNTTLTNYYSQYLYSGSTSVTGGRQNVPEFIAINSSSNGMFNMKFKITNNSYYTYQSSTSRELGTSSLALVDYYGTSQFTATLISSLNIISNNVNGIGIGSRFQLYKRVAPIIADITVSSATTSVDITGLNITKDSEYMLVSTIYNNNGNFAYYSLFANGNTTATNYYRQELLAYSSIISSGRSNDALFTWSYQTNRTNNVYTNIKLTNNGYFVAQSSTIRNAGASDIQLGNFNGTSTFTATSITSLRILSDTANGIGVGSRFQLIKLK